jgi:hypothetical protein
MPGLDIGVVTVEPDYEALVPTVKFKVQVKNAVPNEPITSCLLSCDVYLSIGGRDKWLGKFTSILPLSEGVSLTREAEAVENFALTVDVNNAMSEHLKALKGEDITFKLVFKASYKYSECVSGTERLRSSSTFYGTPPCPTLTRIATLPIDKWKRLLSTYYRNLTWIAVSRETYSLLKERADREGSTLDEVIRRGLAGR